MITIIRIKKTAGYFALLLLIGACIPKPTVRPPDEPVEVPAPALERTFGELRLDNEGQCQLGYKNMVVSFDPKALSLDDSPVDYVFLTNKDAVLRLMARLSTDHRQQKMIVTPDMVSPLTLAGFSQVKALNSGQRLMLQKDGVFVFAEAVQSQPQSSSGLVNAYYLEFENGRRLLFADSFDDMERLREFLYSLRDDGKETHLMVLSGTEAPNSIAEKAGLIQPTVLVLQNAIPYQGKGAQRDALESAMRDHFFNGSWVCFYPGFIQPF